MSVIKLAIGENIDDGYRRINLDHRDGHYDYFLIFSLLFAVDILSNRQVAKTAQFCKNAVTMTVVILTLDTLDNAK